MSDNGGRLIDQYLDVDAAAEQLGVPKGAVLRKVRGGLLRARKLNGRYLFTRDDLREFLEGLEVVGRPAIKLKHLRH